MAGMTMYLTGDPAADELLGHDDLALLLGMLLDQQVTMESAFAGQEPDAFVELFTMSPAVHRFPGSMAARVQAVCQVVRDEWGGEPSAIWTKGDPDGPEILRRLRALPGFGDQKAKIFLALLGPRPWRFPAGMEEEPAAEPPAVPQSVRIAPRLPHSCTGRGPLVGYEETSSPRQGGPVPHDHPLHVDVEVQCHCCRTPQPFRFASPSDQVVCPFCRNHLGSGKAERRDRDHVSLWVQVFSDERDAHAADAARATADAAAAAARVAELEAKVAALSSGVLTEFENTASGGVRAELEGELVRRAERRTELADRRTDRLMGALWRLRLLHRDDEKRPGHCACGRRSAQCAEGIILEQERRAIEEWEGKNAALARAGRRHALPPDHPEA